jgi:hypothetical protein
MARKLQQKLHKVSVYIRIRLTDGCRSLCMVSNDLKESIQPSADDREWKLSA